MAQRKLAQREKGHAGAPEAYQGVRRRARRGLVVTGCSPVKMGAAAIVGSERITIATLNTEVTNLNQAAKKYPSTVQLSPVQETQETLAWLIRFQIFEQMARQAGITVSTTQAQAALAQIYASAKASAQQQGISNVTPELILAANGIPPNLSGELGRYQAIETQFVEQVSGGTIPTSSAAQAAATTKLEQAQCVAAKTLNPVVNPQFGRLSYSQSQFVVVTAPNPVAAPARAREADSVGWAPGGLLIVLLTSPRVAPGLLSWPAWQALRSASSVLVSAGHPQLPALDEAGITYRVADDAPPKTRPGCLPMWLTRPRGALWLPASDGGASAAALLGELRPRPRGAGTLFG